MDSKLSRHEGVLSGARVRLEAAKVVNLRAQGRFDSAKSTLTRMRAELVTAAEAIVTLTASHHSIRADLGYAQRDVARLESRCGLAGVEPRLAVTAPIPPPAKISVADFDARLKAAAKDPIAQARIVKEFEAVVAATLTEAPPL